MAIPFDPEEIREALEDEITDIVRGDAQAISRAVILATPVGNPSLWQSPPPPGYKPGTHRGGWFITINEPGSGDEATSLDTSGGPTIAKAWSRIRTWKVGQGNLVLENHKPAIERLNNGWSTQAPAGFIEQAQAIAVARLAGPVKELP